MEYNLKQSVTDYNEKDINKISNSLKIDKKFAEILYYRGIKTPEEAFDFLNPSLNNLHSPFLFKDMENSINLIKKHIDLSHKICIYGDYDVDGVSGSAILYKGLNELNANVECLLPSRDEHGYGLSMEAIERIADYDLLITVDCGITNINEIKRAKELDLDVIVTDHHECSSVLPPANYIINPKVKDETYPFKYLCGAGVSFKLCEALIGKEAYNYLDIAATATIADMVPLKGENRILAKFGIDFLNASPNLGLGCLIKQIFHKDKKVDSQNVAYMIAPRMNAAGRIAKADIAFELLTASDVKEAEKLAKRLCSLNEERQKRQEKVINEAVELENKYPSDKIIIHNSDKWDVGIIGLGASKLVEKYNKPAILFGKMGDYWTGSARSINGVNILEVLRTDENLYEKFGGHAGAAGLTVKGEYLKRIKTDSNKYLNEHYDESIFTPTKHYDIQLELTDLTKELAESFNKLEPFGFDNKPVEILVKDVKITNIKPIGNNKHARFLIEKDGNSMQAVLFRVNAAEVPEKADVIGTVEMNNFSNKPQIIADVLSYPPTLEQSFNTARTYVRSSVVSNTPELYYLTRSQMGSVYSLFKILSDKKYYFNNETEFINYITGYVSETNEIKLAFAIEVLSELNLIAYLKGDKITVKILPNKRSLEDSIIYKKYQNGVRVNELKREN